MDNYDGQLTFSESGLHKYYGFAKVPEDIFILQHD